MVAETIATKIKTVFLFGEKNISHQIQHEFVLSAGGYLWPLLRKFIFYLAKWKPVVRSMLEIVELEKNFFQNIYFETS